MSDATAPGTAAVSRAAAPRGGPPGPRQAPPPRSGGGAHGAGGPRDPGRRQRPTHLFAAGYAARELEQPGAASVQAEPLAPPDAGPSGGEPERDGADVRVGHPAAAPGELSGLRLLLDELDQLLRDPTLTLALRRFTDKLASALRGLRLPRLRIPHMPRWLLLLPLLLLLGLGLPALFSSGDEDRSASTPAAGSGEVALAGVGMPDLQAAPDDPPPARVALVVGDAYAPADLRRELRTLGAWLAANHAAGTRVTVIDAATGRASAPLNAAALARGAPTRAQAGTSAAIGSAFAGRGRRLLVDVGSSAPASSASRLSVLTRRARRRAGERAAAARAAVERGDRRSAPRCARGKRGAGADRDLRSERALTVDGAARGCRGRRRRAARHAGQRSEAIGARRARRGGATTSGT